MVSNLRKLDTQPSTHAGPPGSGGLDTAQVGMFHEAASSFVHAPVGMRAMDPANRLRLSVAEGTMSEADALELLALFYDYPMADLATSTPGPELRDVLDVSFCLKNQILPWRLKAGEITFATARPERFADLLPALASRLGTGLRASDTPVVALRDAIQGHLGQIHRPTLTAAMSQRVPAWESCRTWTSSTTKQRVIVCLLLALFATLFVIPKVMFFIAVCWATATLIIAMCLKSAAAATLVFKGPIPARLPPDSLDPLPEISLLVPLFRERGIVKKLIRHLENLNYPKDRLDVILVLEELDDITIDAIARIELPYWIRALPVPDGEPRTKPRAMNYALDYCRGEIIGIFDAEDAPDRNQLLNVAERFAATSPQVACLQGALDYFNSRQNWLARCFTIEYNSWFRLVLPGLSQMGLAVPLGGTTVFFRRAPLEELGGWDAHNVTEDADLGFRLARHGYHTEILDTTTYEEANCHAIPWVKQRSRWLKGYIVTYLVHLRRPFLLHRQLGTWQYIGFHAHFISAISQFMLAPLLWSLWMIPLGLPHPLLHMIPEALLKSCAILFFTAEVLNIGLGLIATRKAGHMHLWPWVPTLHCYFPLGCLAIYKAVYELIFCPFYWDKTQHGHSIDTEEAEG